VGVFRVSANLSRRRGGDLGRSFGAFAAAALNARFDPSCVETVGLRCQLPGDLQKEEPDFVVSRTDGELAALASASSKAFGIV
jgi:hypothetical protein